MNPQPEQPKQAYVTQEISSLMSATKGLIEVSLALRDRLSPVLPQEEGGKTAQGGQVRHTMSPLAMRINEARTDVGEATEILQHILKTIEI